MSRVAGGEECSGHGAGGAGRHRHHHVRHLLGLLLMMWILCGASGDVDTFRGASWDVDIFRGVSAQFSLPIGFLRGHTTNKNPEYTFFALFTTMCCSAHDVSPPA